MMLQIMETAQTRAGKYAKLEPQLKALIGNETDLVANLSNTAAFLKQHFDLLGVGFYLVKGSELVLGPFQGEVACTRIGFGRGVCGTAWKLQETIIVPDVDKFPGHIACSSRSRSEIVVPMLQDGSVIGVLDVDSEKKGFFTTVDQQWFEQMTQFIITSGR